MISQPRAVTPFRPSLSSHLHAKGETRPWCEQEIPPQKLEEISGKIALREREQSLAITARLEQKFEAERIDAEALAKANLELERRQSAAREAAAREETRKIAETAAAEKMAAAETNHQQLERHFRPSSSRSRRRAKLRSKPALITRPNFRRNARRARRLLLQPRPMPRLGRSSLPKPPWPRNLLRARRLALSWIQLCGRRSRRPSRRARSYRTNSQRFSRPRMRNSPR